MMRLDMPRWMVLLLLCLAGPGRVAGAAPGTAAALESAGEPGRADPAALRAGAAPRPEVIVRAGERAADLADRLEADGILPRAILEEIAAGEPLADFDFLPRPDAGPPLRRFEGLFAPGTYHPAARAAAPGSDYERGLALVREMLERTRVRLAALEEGSELPPYQTLILASIVEKEAVGGREHGLVASVFRNRMRHGMALGSCPATEYGLGYHRPYLLRSDLQIDTPYNTYRRRGLPPSPISFVSDEALRAAARPPASPFLFFCLDWTTLELHFAVGFEEHQANVAATRRNFIRRFGAERMYRRHPDKFYEP